MSSWQPDWQPFAMISSGIGTALPVKIQSLCGILLYQPSTRRQRPIILAVHKEDRKEVNRVVRVELSLPTGIRPTLMFHWLLGQLYPSSASCCVSRNPLASCSPSLSGYITLFRTKRIWKLTVSCRLYGRLFSAMPTATSCRPSVKSSVSCWNELWHFTRWTQRGSSCKGTCTSRWGFIQPPWALSLRLLLWPATISISLSLSKYWTKQPFGEWSNVPTRLRVLRR